MPISQTLFTQRDSSSSAMAYERSLFSSKEPNLRMPAASWLPGVMGHQAAMKRLASLPYLDDAAIHAEIEAALGTTRAYGFGGGSILCHGDAGNLETLLVASQVIATPLREEIMQRAGALLDSMPAEEGVTELP